MIKVLLIDDDRKHSELLKAYLKQFGIALDCAGDADEGFRRLSRSDPDLLLLDVMLPGRDGFDICREVRQTSRIPIIMLTARGDVVDRVSGLEIGADDYIGKPFEPRELLARIQTILRRAAPAAANGVRQLRFEGGLVIDLDRRTVQRGSETIELTSTEFDLLVMLAQAPAKVFNRDDILEKLRGQSAEDIHTRAVDILVSRLRRKLEPLECIKTLRNAGYTFAGVRE